MIIASQVSDIVLEVDLILKTLFGKSLYYPKPDDQMRLLRLRVWSERYKVSLTYIVSKLVPYYAYISKKRTGRDTKGIGTTISVFTGAAAESYIKECIAKDYPDNEHLADWRENKQEEVLALVRKSLEKKPKTILRYRTVEAFRSNYVRQINKKRYIDDKLIKKIYKQPWRGNPFR